MLIKNYTLGMPAKVAITEKVTDVVVHLTVHKGNSTGDPCGVDSSPNTWVYQDNVADDQDVSFIDYTQDGVRCRLYVTNFAYVCNDEGKTIQKVSPLNLHSR